HSMSTEEKFQLFEFQIKQSNFDFDDEKIMKILKDAFMDAVGENTQVTQKENTQANQKEEMNINSSKQAHIMDDFTIIDNNDQDLWKIPEQKYKVNQILE